MNNEREETVVADLYDNYHETQKELLQILSAKTRNKLFTIATVMFGFGLLSLAMINAVTAQTILAIAIFSVIIGLLGLLATKEPLLAMILATIIIVGLFPSLPSVPNLQLRSRCLTPYYAQRETLGKEEVYRLKVY